MVYSRGEVRAGQDVEKLYLWSKKTSGQILVVKTDREVEVLEDQYIRPRRIRKCHVPELDLSLCMCVCVCVCVHTHNMWTTQPTVCVVRACLCVARACVREVCACVLCIACATLDSACVRLALEESE